ncbi:hypothetical protein ACJIZ3_020558 [Penstemon smallii]|uniref:Uncharacterized protein n=1 Tax=Penstemon smallii TaxID=265156 RepID=A0ABD3SIY4_9LAMI
MRLTITTLPRETTTNLVTVFLNATLPYYAIPTVEDLEFEVMIIKLKFKSSSVIFNLKLFNIDVFCNDMKIGILSNATYGYFMGTPKSCSSLFRGRKIN